MFLPGGATLTAAQNVDLQAAQQLNRKGEQLLERSQFNEALRTFTRMLELCGGNEQCRGAAQFYIGRCHMELAQWDRALEFLDRAADIFSRLKMYPEQGTALHSKARVFHGKTDYRQAILYYSQAEAKLAAAGQNGRAELFNLLVGRAGLYIELRKYEAAEQDLRKAKGLFPSSKDPPQLALLADRQAQIFYQQQRYSDAESLYRDAIRHYQQYGNRQGEATALNQMGLIHEEKAEFSQALKLYQDSLRLSEELGDLTNQMRVLNQLGNVYTKTGNYPKAVELFDRSLKISRDRMRQSYARTLNNKGVVYLYSGDYRKALKHFDECKTIGEKGDDRVNQANALNNIAWLFKETGNLKDARLSAVHAKGLAHEILDSRLEANVTQNLGRIHEYYGDFDGAIREYRAAAKIQRQIGDQLWLSDTLLYMAGILVRQGKWDCGEDERGEECGVERLYQEALKLKKDIGVLQGHALCEFALSYIEKDRYAAATESAPGERDKRLQLARDLLNRAQQAIPPDERHEKMLLTYAWGAYFLQKDPAKAVEKFKELQSQAQSSESRKYQFLARVGLGLSYEALDDLPRAEEAFKAAVEYSEELRETLDPKQKSTFLNGEEVLGMKHVVPYEGLARVRLRRGDASRALEAAEFTKGRGFADKLAQSVGAGAFGIDKKLYDELTDVENKIAGNRRQREKCLEKDGDRGLIPGIDKELKDLDKSLVSIKKRIESISPKFHAARFPRPLPITESELKDGESAVIYEVTDTGVLIFVTKGKQIVHAVFKPIKREKLDGLVRRFVGPMESRDPLKSFGFSTGRELYRILLSEALPYVDEGKPLIVVPDDSLAVLPFEMLVAGDGGTLVNGKQHIETKGAKFFADRNAIVYSQSISALSVARRTGLDRPPPAGKLLVIAIPTLSSGRPCGSDDIDAERKRQIDAAVQGGSAPRGRDEQLARLSPETSSMIAEMKPLPETTRLAQQLRKTFGDQVKAYSGDEATKKAFMTEIAPRAREYGRMVFATHGYFGNALPDVGEPVLMLRMEPPCADNLLRMREVMDLNMNADVVSLVACQTGLGEQISGEGTMSMGRAFQYAGAKSVLMSLWSVEPDAATTLAEAFFSHIKGGKNKLEALQAARQDIRAKGFDHPFFWAAFVIVGEKD